MNDAMSDEEEYFGMTASDSEYLGDERWSAEFNDALPAQYIRQTGDGKDRLQCEACQKFFECVFPDTDTPHIDGGCTVSVSVGQYAGFNDTPAGDVSALLCHDCTLEIYRKIPKLAAMSGLHPIECCHGGTWGARRLQEMVRYTKIFNELFGPFSDSDIVEWPIFDDVPRRPRDGGCEFSW